MQSAKSGLEKILQDKQPGLFSNKKQMFKKKK